MPTDLLQRTGAKLQVCLHAGQARAIRSTKRIVAVIAGAQSGKTVVGPPWLHREMTRRGPGDYLIASPTFKLMSLKVLPEVKRFFERHLQAGKLTGGNSPEFTFSPEGEQRIFGCNGEQPSRILFGHAGDPESLESATAKAVWCDEVGQKRFHLASWEAVQRRVAIHEGRILLTTTPYDLGWLKQRLHDPWEASGRNHPDIDIIGFDSLTNPAFPRAEFERAMRDLPWWKFDLFYRGQFTRPAGLIYDSFDSLKHVRRRFEIPPRWPRFVGLDFGPVNTAAVFFAEEPHANRLWLYREYHPGVKRTPQEHVRSILHGEPEIPVCFGGSRSEDEWRDEFAAAGLPIHQPLISNLEVGIDGVYAAFRYNQILVFDDCTKFLDQVSSYSREVNDQGEPTINIEAKDTYHILDATRYIVPLWRSWIGETQEPDVVLRA